MSRPGKQKKIFDLILDTLVYLCNNWGMNNTQGKAPHETDKVYLRSCMDTTLWQLDTLPDLVEDFALAIDKIDDAVTEYFWTSDPDHEHTLMDSIENDIIEIVKHIRSIDDITTSIYRKVLEIRKG